MRSSIAPRSAWCLAVIASFEHRSCRCCQARWRRGAWRAQRHSLPTWRYCIIRKAMLGYLGRPHRVSNHFLRNWSSLVARGKECANAPRMQCPSQQTERDLRHDARVDRDTARVDDRCREFSTLMTLTLSRLMRYLMHLERKEAAYLQAFFTHCIPPGNTGSPRSLRNIMLLWSPFTTSSMAIFQRRASTCLLHRTYYPWL
jgi:hypothetical protein